MDKKFVFFILLMVSYFHTFSQDSLSMEKPKSNEKVNQVFKDRRVINSHSTEMLKAGKLDFRVAHRFGDIAGEGGGWQSLYGLESASDILIGFDYGITDQVLVGISRTKGAGPLRQNLNGQLKLKLISQRTDGSPVSIALFGLGTYTTMPKGVVQGELDFFEKTLHRFSYHSDLIISSKISNGFSLQALAGYTYRNLVNADDTNGLLSVGLAARLQVTKAIGLIFDGRLPVSDIRQELRYFPLGAGIEWETGGGHVFQINVTNSRGISETDFIPYTNEDWSAGQFRVGFTISRQFSL